MRVHLRVLIRLLPGLQSITISEAMDTKVGHEIFADHSKNAVGVITEPLTRSSSSRSGLSQIDAGSASFLAGIPDEALDDVKPEGYWRLTYQPTKSEIDSFRHSIGYDVTALLEYATDKTLVKELLDEVNRYHRRIADLLQNLSSPMSRPSPSRPGPASMTNDVIVDVENSRRGHKAGQLSQNSGSLYYDHFIHSNRLETPRRNADILAGFKKCLRQIRFPDPKDQAFSLDKTLNLRAPFETKVFQAVEYMYQSDLISVDQMIDFFSDDQILEITARHLPIKLDLRDSASWKGFSLDIDLLEKDLRYSHLKWCLSDMPENLQMQITWVAYKSAVEIFKSQFQISFDSEFQKTVNLFIHSDFLKTLALSKEGQEHELSTHFSTSGQASSISRQGSWCSGQTSHTSGQGSQISRQGSNTLKESSDVSGQRSAMIQKVVQHFKEFWQRFINQIYQGFTRSKQPTPINIEKMKSHLKDLTIESRTSDLPHTSKSPIYDSVMVKRFEDSMNFNMYLFLTRYWKPKPVSLDSTV